MCAMIRQAGGTLGTFGSSISPPTDVVRFQQVRTTGPKNCCLCVVNETGIKAMHPTTLHPSSPIQSMIAEVETVDPLTTTRLPSLCLDQMNIEFLWHQHHRYSPLLTPLLRHPG